MSGDLRFSGSGTTMPRTRAVSSSSVRSTTDWLNMVRARILQQSPDVVEQQLARSADGATIPVVYGYARVGALIKNVVPYNGMVYVECLWAHQGDSILDVKLANKDLPAGYTLTNYDGSQGSTDSTFSAAMSANGYTYAEYNPGVMMSIIGIPIAAFKGSLEFSAKIKGRKVLDTRTSTTAWSDCPALALRDFLTDTTYGCGKTVVATSVNTVADLNDAMVGATEKRRLIGLAITDRRRMKDHVDVLRTYAGCFLSFTESGIKLVGDTTRTTDATYSHTSGEILQLVSCEKKDQLDVPTVVEVQYTNTGVFPYRNAYATVEASGVAGGTVPRRVSQIPLPGITRHSQATREATERLNKLITQDLVVVVDVFDKGIAHEEGDVIEVSHPIGLASKKLRIGSPQLVGPNVWRITGTEYDPAAYSDSLATGPTYADTDCIALPAPMPINLVDNADFTDDLGWGSSEYADTRSLRDWTGVAVGGALARWGRNYDGGVRWNLGRGGAYMRVAEYGPSSSKAQYMYRRFPCNPGSYYEAQILASIHRCEGWFYLRFLNLDFSAGYDAMGAADSLQAGSGIIGSATTLEDHHLFWRFGKAPVAADGASGWSDSTAHDAAWVVVIPGMTCNGEDSPYTLWQRLAIFDHGTRSGLTKAQATPWIDFNSPTIDGGQLPRHSVTGIANSTSGYTSTSYTVGNQYWYCDWEALSVSWTNDTPAEVDVNVGFSWQAQSNFAGVQTNVQVVKVTVNGSASSNYPNRWISAPNVWENMGGSYTVQVPSGQQIVAKLIVHCERLAGGYSGATLGLYVTDAKLDIETIRK
ncbi:MAG TPA: phage tail protein [Casimicrobiaceae bacterium]|nr:phage tail protein [Casimicrobiaceae bacterium]